MALELIKINAFPQVSDPKDWIVVSDESGTGYKISKQDFKDWLGTVQVVAPRALAPTDPPPPFNGVYLPTIDGTYANAGGLTVNRSEGGADYGMSVQFIQNGATWVKVTEPYPQAENRIPDWVAGTYTQGAQVIHNGQIWSVEPEIASTTQEPGVGDDWKGDIDLIPIIPSRNIARKSLLEWGVYRPTGVVSSAATHTYIRIEIPGIVEGKWYGASGGGGANLQSSWARLVWFDSDNSVVGYLPNTSNFPIKEQAPTGAVKLGITVAQDSSVFPSLTDNIYANSLMVVELVDENEQIPNYTPPDLKQISIDTVNGLGEALASVSSDECFFEFNPTGFLGRGMFIVYVKRDGAGNIYTGYKIGHRYDMSDLVYVDYYEIIEAFDYLYNGDIMIPTGRKTLFGGESEFTMKVEEKLDHTGGAHGDEIQSDFEFKPNGVKINDLSNAIPLTKCDFFEYSVKSTLHETVNTDAPTVPIEGHPLVANHVKNTFFRNRSLIVNNFIEVKQEFIPERIYTGLFCISNDQVLVGRNEWFNEANFVGDNAQKLNYTNRGYRDFYGYSNSHSAFATSKMMDNNELDKVAGMFVTDRPDGPKYYRYIKPSVAMVGDIWHFISEFKPATIETN